MSPPAAAPSASRRDARLGHAHNDPPERVDATAVPRRASRRRQRRRDTHQVGHDVGRVAAAVGEQPVLHQLADDGVDGEQPDQPGQRDPRSQPGDTQPRRRSRRARPCRRTGSRRPTPAWASRARRGCTATAADERRPCPAVAPVPVGSRGSAAGAIRGASTVESPSGAIAWSATRTALRTAAATVDETSGWKTLGTM